MKVVDIYELEDRNKENIFLIRNALFFQAWERSAMLFKSLFFDYKINFKHYLNIGKDLVYLGFPVSVLPIIKKICAHKSYTLQEQASDLIKISNLPAIDIDFVAWKADHTPVMQIKPSADVSLPAFKVAYELCLYLCKLCSKFSKNYRYSLGENLRKTAVLLCENLYLATKIEKHTFKFISSSAEELNRLRIQIRLLKDLQQITIKQWAYINREIDDLQKNLMTGISKFKDLESASNVVPQSTQTSFN